MTTNERGSNVVIWVAIAFAIMVAFLMLMAKAAFGQTNMGPIKTNQINQDLFVGQSGYATIQSAVNFGCKTGNHNFRVVIPAGATPTDTPTAITGGCTGTYIDDKRTNNELLYSWNGTVYVVNPPPTGGGDGGGAAPAQVPYAFNFTDPTLQKLAATENATYDPATNTITFNATFTQTNGYFGFSIFHPQPNVPSGYGDDGQGIGNISTGNSGPGKTVGNPNGIINYDGGWRSIHGPQWLIQKIASGIGNGFELTLDASAAIGDSKAFSIGHSSAGGCQAASDECYAQATFAGGQGPEYTGTVVSTKGQGDITPLFSGPVINGGFIEDLSKVVLTGNITAASLPWTQSPTVHVGSLPVSATVTPSTWVANLTSVIAASQILSVPQPQAFTATTVQGAEGAPGTVWVASSNYSEQCSVNGSTISCAYGHAIGDQIFKGGTQGCLSMDLEAAQAPNFTNHTDVLVYGGIDTSHLATGFTTSQGLQNFPIPGTMFSGTTSPFHVVQCARVVSLLADKLTETLETNNVNWGANDTIVAPNPTSAHTYGFVVGMNQLSPNNPSITDQEFSQHCTGMGCSGQHFPFFVYNHNPPSKYAQGMTYNPNNNLQAWEAGPRVIGPYSNLFDLDLDPMYSNVPGSSLACVATIFCRRNLSNNTLPWWMWQNGQDGMDYMQITYTPTKQVTFGYQMQAASFINLPQSGPFNAFIARSVFNSGTGAGYAYASQYDGSGINNTEIAAVTSGGLSYGGQHWWKLDVAGMPDVIHVENGQVAIHAGFNPGIAANQPLLCSDMYGNVSTAPTGSTCTVGERGTVTLSAGSVTVPSTTITLAGVVFLQNCNVSGTPGILTVGARLAGTSFVINSTNSSDNSQVCWFVPTAVTATRQRRPPIRAAAPPSSQHPAPPRRPGRPS